MNEQETKTVPVCDGHSRELKDVVGSLKISTDMGELLAEGRVRLDPCILKHQDGTLELVEVSFVPSIPPARDVKFPEGEYKLKVRPSGVSLIEKQGEEFATLVIEKSALDLWDFEGITQALGAADFFKELHHLCKDELDEGDSVCPVVIAKLKLLEAAKEMKLGIPYLTSKGYIEFARARFELNEEEVEEIRKVVHGAQDRRSREKRGEGS